MSRKYKVLTNTIYHMYFDSIAPLIEDNEFFYDNLLGESNRINIHDPRDFAEYIHTKISHVIDPKSDFDEIFVRITDKDIAEDNNSFCTKVIILLYHKLNVILEDETIHEYLSTINNNHANGHIYEHTPDHTKQIIQKNKQDMIKFIIYGHFFNNYWSPM
jgi:hypothetical protein